MKKIFLPILLFGVILALLISILQRPRNSEIKTELIPRPHSESEEINLQGFERAFSPKPISFPQDFGEHPNFQTEWWYYTGNLDTVDGLHFGYQLTFFRRALIPPAERQPRQSKWAADQAFLAHFAITDVEKNQHQAFERYSRGSAGLAGAQSLPYQVWLEDWSISQIAQNQYRLRASQGDIELDLILEDIKGPVLQGERGYSQKGPQPGNASYYISQTRLKTEGRLETGGNSYQVYGTSWMDHEFSTSALSEDQVGWDWFALQLEDGIEVMLFTIRKTDGSIDPHSSGTIIAQDGSTRTLSREDFKIEILDYWKSPESKANYPAHWRVHVPSEKLVLEIKPFIADQELNLSYEYWEGAVQIRGERQNSPIAGYGYLELTGYSGSFAGEF